MRITNIAQANFGYLTNDGVGPKLEITLEGRSDEFKHFELVGREVDIVSKTEFFNKTKISDQEDSLGDSTSYLAECLGIWPDKKRREKSLTLNKLFVKNVYYNKEKGVTVVIFEDGVKITKKLSEGDIFDIRTAVALAIAERMYGSRTKFAKTVDKIAVDQVEKSKKKAEKKVDAE